VPRLIIIKGPDFGRQFELTDACVGIGREASNSIRLHDTEASRRHAEFRRQTDGGYHLVDIGSANGTLVNNKAAQDMALSSGDYIQIGQTIMAYDAGRPESNVSDKLAEHFRLIGKQDESPSEIIKTIGETEGSRILSQPETAGSPWLKTRLANLGVMYETIQAISHILDVDQLLYRILELIFKSIEADRGGILLCNTDANALEPRAVRYREGTNADEKIGISRTITEYVLHEKQGVLVADATCDERFSSGQSIVRFGIREAICVPMKGRHETLGVLYLDTQSTSKEVVARGTPTGKFTEDHLALAIAIGHQAAMAIEETRYHQAMVQAERLAAVGQTIAALSHHIKNILQGLRSGNELLKMGITDNDQEMLHKGWRILDKNQGKIYDLVLDMLNYSKERVPNVEPTNINQIVADVVELLKVRVMEQAVQLQLQLDPQLPQVQADPEGIHRAILNIFGNALDAVSDRQEPQVGIRTMVEPGDEWLAIAVVDNGAGIPPEKLSDIFKPFVSSKGARGTGLGLPVSKKILQEHGGDITVKSKPGKGSQFTLRLPLKSPFAQDASHTLQHTVVPPPPN